VSVINILFRNPAEHITSKVFSIAKIKDVRTLELPAIGLHGASEIVLFCYQNNYQIERFKILGAAC